MNDSPWQAILSDREIPAAPSGGMWTPVLDYVPAGTLLKIEASGEWNYADDPAATVGADGDPESPVPREQLLNAKAPIGALIGKIGGSTAEIDGIHSFVAGSYCVLEVPADKGGALMLAMNNLVSARDGTSDALKVSIHKYETPSAPAPAPAPGRKIVIAEVPPQKVAPPAKP